MLLACLSGLFATTKNLIREDMFVRTGFEKAWLKIWPERTKGSGDWHHVPSSPGDNRPVKIASLGAPFAAPNIYRWPSEKIHEYTAITRFFMQPEERKALVSWGLRLGSIAVTPAGGPFQRTGGDCADGGRSRQPAAGRRPPV